MNYRKLSAEELEDLYASGVKELIAMEQAFTELTDQLDEIKAAMNQQEAA